MPGTSGPGIIGRRTFALGGLVVHGIPSSGDLELLDFQEEMKSISVS